MDELSKLLRVIDGLYASVLDENRWFPALQSLLEFVGGTGAFDMIADPVSKTLNRSESIEVDPVVNKLFREHYFEKEIRMPPALRFPVGTLMTGEMLVNTRQFERSEIYGELLAPYDIPHIMVLWTAKSRSEFSAISIQHAKRQGPFEKSDLERYAPIVPHLIRAVRLRKELLLLRNQHRIHMDAIYSLPFAIAFLDPTGRIIENSPAAAALLRAEQGIVQKGGRIRAVFSDDDRRLQRAIFSAGIDPTARAACGDTVAVKRQNGRLPLSINVIPMRSPEIFVTAGSVCMLAIFDPESSPKPAVVAVQKALQLTEAEALLACILFTGVSLQEAAKRLNVSVNTCKSQLKSIYAKTGCRSQVDLAKMLLLSGIAHG